MGSNALSNREIALFIWITFSLVLILVLPKMKEARKSLGHLIKAFFKWKIQVVLLLMLGYVAGIIYMLVKLDLWGFNQIKNTIIWITSVAFLLIFQVEAIKKDRNFFKHLVLDNLKLVAVLEFIIGLYSFSLFIEILLLPFLVFVGLLQFYTERDERHNTVKNLLNGFLALFGMFLLGHAIYNILSDKDALFDQGNLYDFILPPILTLLYIPFLFFLMVYMSYENFLVTLPQFIGNKRKRFFATIIAMLAFNVRVELLERWRFVLPNENTDSYKGLLNSIWRVFKMRKAERKPAHVPIEEGWSPYLAKEALIKHGLKTGYYKESYGEWFACSQMMTIGEGVFASNIAYYVDGNEKSATSLKLKLNVNKIELGEISQERLSEIGQSLYQFATGKDIPDWLKIHLRSGEPIAKKEEIYLIEIEKQIFETSNYNGYDVKFIISIDEKLVQ